MRPGGARRSPADRWARCRDRGSVTAELAAALPVVVFLLLGGVAGVNAVVTKLRCVDAAREAALAQARGEAGGPAGRRSAPAGATVSVHTDGATVRATVRATAHPFGRHLPGFRVEADAVAAAEPGTP